MSPRPLLFVLCFACLTAVSAGEPEAPQAPRAKDGVLFDNEKSSELMKMPSLSGNLLSNGSFEKGRWWPEGWWPTDGLASAWVEGGTDGKRCMKVFTGVEDSQWIKHEKLVRATIDALTAKGIDPQKLAKNPLPPTPTPKLAGGAKYSAVGGIHGVHYRSEYITCEPGAVYRFSVDCRNGGRGAPRVFIKGFFDHKMKTAKGEEIVRRNAYKAPMILDPCSKEWRRYARLLHPSLSTSTLDKKKLKTEYLQVQLYSYWPVGNYFWDNVKLEIVGREEVPKEEEKPKPDEAVKEPETPKNETTPKDDDEEFPEFD
jgi:hypothetical protein